MMPALRLSSTPAVRSSVESPSPPAWAKMLLLYPKVALPKTNTWLRVPSTFNSARAVGVAATSTANRRPRLRRVIRLAGTMGSGAGHPVGADRGVLRRCVRHGRMDGDHLVGGIVSGRPGPGGLGFVALFAVLAA